MIKKTGCVFVVVVFFYLTQKDIYQKKKINSKLIKEVKKTRLNSTYSLSKQT